MTRPLRIAIVAGEESGDLLGADLVAALARLSGRPVELVGVGGRHLREACAQRQDGIVVGCGGGANEVVARVGRLHGPDATRRGDGVHCHPGRGVWRVARQYGGKRL